MFGNWKSSHDTPDEDFFQVKVEKSDISGPVDEKEDVSRGATGGDGICCEREIISVVNL